MTSTLQFCLRFSRWIPGLAALLASLLVSAGTPSEALANELDDLQRAQEQMMRELEASQATEQRRSQQQRDAEEVRRDEEAERRRQDARRRSERNREGETLLNSLIEEELEVQVEMLERADRNQTATERGLLGAHASSESPSGDAAMGARTTPTPAADRDLPRAIFEERDITIAPRTWGNEDRLKLTELVLDADRDGVPEVVRYLDRKSDRPVRQEEDRNYDGAMDAWKDYRDGRLVRRTLDRNFDGNPDSWEEYAKGRLTERRADHDDDGVVDAIFRYDASYLTEEAHDANADGEIDLVIRYQKGHRVKANEDRDRDGRDDTWTVYRLVDDMEMVVRIERDKRGRGYADTFESFDPVEGRSILARREEDVNGDGKVDMISIYQHGKLVRREIYDPAVVKL